MKMYLFGIIFLSGAVFGNEMDESNESKLGKASGDYPQATIIDGYEVTLEEFPYAARLYGFRGRELSTCTAEIIGKRLLMTAAHCAVHKAFMVVVAGLADQRDYVAGKNLNKYARYRVSQAYIHPQYNTHTAKHDVAIVKLAKPMSHKGYGILPINYDRLESLTQAVIYGWGTTEKNSRNNQLFAKNLSVQMCTKSYDTGYEFLCLAEPGTDKGDSGGPIIIDGKLRGICSHIEPTPEFHKKPKYYFIALWEEKEFLASVINAANYNRCFLFLIAMSFIFII